VKRRLHVWFEVTVNVINDQGAYSDHLLRRGDKEKDFSHHVTRRICAKRVFSDNMARKGDAEKKFG
jgi:hypothetical protein